MTKIFISYRRQSYFDGEWREHDFDINFVGRLTARLGDALEYGDDAVFRDVDDILGGREFEKVIGTALDEATALLVIITPRWLTAADEHGNRRLDDPNDWVRREVEHGLARPDLLVIPVIAGSATKPKSSDLPESMQPLLGRNWVEVRDSTFDHDYRKLTKAIGGRRGARRWGPVAAAAMVGLVVLGALGLQAVRGGSDDGGSSDEAAPAPAAVTTTTEPVEPMSTGSFNVAVADFASDRPETAGAAAALASEFSDRLERDLAAGGAGRAVEVRGPDVIGPLDGDDDDSRTQAAQELAGRINAAVVIGGEVAFEGNQTSVRPNAVLNPEAMAVDPTMGGSWALGPLTVPGSLSSNLDAGPQLIEALSITTGGIGAFIDGVGSYQKIDGERESALANAPIVPGSAQEYRRRAQASFEAALASNSLPPNGQAAAHVFLGSLALLRSDQFGARQAFEAALELDPGSARARLGLAEVELQTSTAGGCAPGTVDAAGLERAADGLRAAADQPDQPEAVQLKADLGRARVLRCQSQAGLAEEFAAAEALLRDVIAEAGEAPELRELTAIAHAELALVVAPPVGGAPDPEALASALDESKAAVDTTGRAENEVTFLVQSAFYLQQLGRSDEATATLAEAAALDPKLAGTTVADLVPQPAGRTIPRAGLGVPTTSGSLPLTGRPIGREVALGLALLAAGLTLVRCSARLARRGAGAAAGAAPS